MSVSRTEPLGQLLMVGLSEERWTSTLERHLLSIKPGGILLSPRQLRKPDSAAELLKNAARTLPAACFLALEEEGGPRSEEHTSELQSRLHLVCRLLLEKKNHYVPSIVSCTLSV